MGEIIAFPSQTGAKRTEARRAGEEAQILFFTGVRYVPASEPASEPSVPSHTDDTPRGGRRRRER